MFASTTLFPLTYILQDESYWVTADDATATCTEAKGDDEAWSPSQMGLPANPQDSPAPEQAKCIQQQTEHSLQPREPIQLVDQPEKTSSQDRAGKNAMKWYFLCHVYLPQ